MLPAGFGLISYCQPYLDTNNSIRSNSCILYFQILDDDKNDLKMSILHGGLAILAKEDQELLDTITESADNKEIKRLQQDQQIIKIPRRQMFSL